MGSRPQRCPRRLRVPPPSRWDLPGLTWKLGAVRAGQGKRPRGGAGLGVKASEHPKGAAPVKSYRAALARG